MPEPLFKGATCRYGTHSHSTCHLPPSATLLAPQRIVGHAAHLLSSLRRTRTSAGKGTPKHTTTCRRPTYLAISPKSVHYRTYNNTRYLPAERIQQTQRHKPQPWATPPAPSWTTLSRGPTVRFAQRHDILRMFEAICTSLAVSRTWSHRCGSTLFAALNYDEVADIL